MSTVRGLELSRKFYEECGKKLIASELADLEGQIAAGLVGEGSECFGLDDDISRDHDWGPAFCLWLPEDLLVANAERIEKALSGLPESFEGFRGRMKPEERRAEYAKDITYVTNNELGFDYLRDNMVIYKEQLVQRGLHFAIIDEVDSVLIDEARTPLIISGQSGKSTKLYEACDILARQLERGEASGEFSKMNAIMGEDIEETGDFIVNEKEKTVNLTEDGVKKVEKFFHIENLADPENLEIQHNIILALRAHNLMFRDQDYVVTPDGEVMIVDEFTGRIMPGRRYSDGLHQAIEAKEHVKVKRESKTLATITFQNLFNKFDKKSGMTGTALTEEKEFRDIYGMDVVEIPTNVPVQRVDLEDAVYKTKEEKYKIIYIYHTCYSF